MGSVLIADLLIIMFGVVVVFLGGRGDGTTPSASYRYIIRVYKGHSVIL